MRFIITFIQKINIKKHEAPQRIKCSKQTNVARIPTLNSNFVNFKYFRLNFELKNLL